MIISTIASNNQMVSFEAMKSWLKLPAYSKLWTEGPYIDFNRNEIWRRMKEIPLSEHLLFIDIDIVFTLEDVTKIEQHLNNGLDIVGGVYLIGKPPKDPCIFERVLFQDKFKDVPISDSGDVGYSRLKESMGKAEHLGDYKLTALKEGLNEVDAIGTGFLGINADVIEKMSDNPFSYLKEGEITHGEDISFCFRASKMGFKIFADSSIRLGHVRSQVIY